MFGIFKSSRGPTCTPEGTARRDQVIALEKDRHRKVVNASSEGSARIARLLSGMRGELDGEYGSASDKPFR